MAAEWGSDGTDKEESEEEFGGGKCIGTKGVELALKLNVDVADERGLLLRLLDSTSIPLFLLTTSEETKVSPFSHTA